MPSRFLDELPEAHVEVMVAKGTYGGFAASRFDEAGAFGSSYGTPGWQRAQRHTRGDTGGFDGNETQDYENRAGARVRHGGANSGRDSAQTRANVSPAGRQSSRNQHPHTIEGELIARSTGATSAYRVGDRVFHLKFGNGNVVAVDGNKLLIQFDKAGAKRVVDSFVERA